MPIRFSTVAANADKLEADDDIKAPQARAPRQPADRAPSQAQQPDSATQAKPGKDINAAGFVKDKDAGKP
jgi:hypothetical protein